MTTESAMIQVVVSHLRIISVAGGLLHTWATPSNRIDFVSTALSNKMVLLTEGKNVYCIELLNSGPAVIGTMSVANQISAIDTASWSSQATIGFVFIGEWTTNTVACYQLDRFNNGALNFTQCSVQVLSTSSLIFQCILLSL